ncbi:MULTISPECIES: hypothetical protein [unclassified Halobacteriovorax]|uniref:hypothetical protein n=1 Tax=unclassified Halobacteriovorax TaxID=2639665 RepID=UPI00399BA6AA
MTNNNKDYEKEFEDIIRDIFDSERSGDPAKIGDTSCFQDSYINEVKSGLGYALSFLKNNFESLPVPNDEIIVKIEEQFSKLWSAQKCEETKDIIDVINEIKDKLNTCKGCHK